MPYVVTSPGGTVTLVRDRNDPAAVRTSEFHRLVPDMGASYFFCAGKYEITGRFNEEDQVRRCAIDMLTEWMEQLKAEWIKRNACL